MEPIAVAALSARPLAEAAAREGLRALALDLFGDQDTCAAAALGWRPIGDAAALRIDGARLLAALRDCAAGVSGVSGAPAPQAWIAGAGFEAQPALLAEAAAVLPLLGTAPAAQQRVRDPARFFGLLDTLGARHPPHTLAAPADGAGWLVKDAGGCGGWHIRRATDHADLEAATGRYWQRELPGTPMSATFIANGRGARVLGVNEQRVQALGERPYVFAGLVGPLPVPRALHDELERIVAAATLAFELRGLGSLDFLLDGTAVQVLELNPRPPASLALYPEIGGQGVLAAHVAACRGGALPAPPPAARTVAGTEIVFAPRGLQVDAALATAIAHQPGTCDLPRPGTTLAAGDPLCSLRAQAASAAGVALDLKQRRLALLHTLEHHR